jgi:hypothetical protein
MWAEVTRRRREFESVVLTGVDEAGFPFSVRCRPVVDTQTHTLRIDAAPGVSLVPGPASLLGHSFDAKLWNLRSFVVRGRLESTPEGWVFHPAQFIPGSGMRGLFDQFITLGECRRAAAKYLRARSLPRPAVPWDEINRLHREAKRPGGALK